MIRLSCLLVAAALALGASAQAQEPEGSQNDAAQEAQAAGRADYAQNCLSCHGPEAKGNGPWAPYMTIPPPDLTTLAKRNNGTFPYYRVYRIIENGSAAPEHSFTSMPAWGKIFAEQPSAFFTDTAVEGRLLDLVEYIQSIQADQAE